jgi:hypothetical protein
MVGTPLVIVKNRDGRFILRLHHSRRLLLQPPIRKPELIAVFFLRARIIQKALDLASSMATHLDGGRARRSVGQHTVSNMPPSLTAPRARRTMGVFDRALREHKRRIGPARSHFLDCRGRAVLAWPLFHKDFRVFLNQPTWGCSAVGSAREWHSRGRRFNPGQLHQLHLAGYANLNTHI